MTLEEFRKICEEHGIFVLDQVYESIYGALKKKLKFVGEKNPTQQVIAAYCEAYKAKHGSNPDIEPTAAKRLQTTVKAIGVPRMIALINIYLEMRDEFFIRRGFDLDTFRINITKIGRFHDTGQMPTANQARSEERSQGSVNAIRNYREKQRRLQHGGGSTDGSGTG